MWRPGSRDNRISNNSGWILLAAVGLVLALVGARIEQPHDGTGETLAWVNERPVTRDQLGHAQRRLNRGGGSLGEAELRSVINMLIDEELLLQRAETLGVVDTDPGVRKAIVQASIDRIVDEFSARPVGPGQLEKFYRGHQAVLAVGPRWLPVPARSHCFNCRVRRCRRMCCDVTWGRDQRVSRFRWRLAR
jgi:hypothetical protein